MQSNVDIITYNPYNETRLIESLELDTTNGHKEEFSIIKDGKILRIDYRYVNYVRTNWAEVFVTEELQKDFTICLLSDKGLEIAPVGKLDLSKYFSARLVFISTAKLEFSPQFEENLWKIWYVHSQKGVDYAKAIAKEILQYDETEAMMIMFAEYFLGDLKRTIAEKMPSYNWNKENLLCLAEELAEKDKQLRLNSVVEQVVVPKVVTAISHNVIPLNVRTVVMHDRITTIRSWAFRSRRIDSLALPDSLTHIESYAFFGSKINNLKMSKNIKTIEDSAFVHATIPQELIFENGLETIGDDAFRHTNVAKVVLPKTIKFLGWHAFDECQNLKEVVMPNWFRTVLEGYGKTQSSIMAVREFDKLRNIFGDNYKNIKFTFLDNDGKPIA